MSLVLVFLQSIGAKKREVKFWKLAQCKQNLTGLISVLPSTDEANNISIMEAIKQTLAGAFQKVQTIYRGMKHSYAK